MKFTERRFLPVALLVFTLSLGVVIGTLINTGVNAAGKGQAAPDATPLVVPPVQQVGNEFTKLAKKLDPSVVNITAEITGKSEQARRGRAPQAQPGEEEDGADLFRRFFPNMPGGPNGAPQMPRNFRREQGGTGFIVDKNGYIITNNHVVDGVDRIKVKMHGDQAEYKAKLIGVDPETDLAVIKIDPKQPLTPVTIANSESVQVGDWAVAIGSPFGLEASVTAGIVSATGRDIGSQQFQRFIQTDAAINPGNSGGPLLNIRGEVIGVNTMIATQNGGSQGVGFALPINMAVRVYNDIIKHGEVRRGSIGISWQRDEKPEVLKALGTNGGVLVSDVKKGGPAEKAGLKAEDIVVALNGAPIRNGDDLVNRVADLPLGSQATVTVDRAGKRMDFKVTVLDRKEVFADDPRVTGGRPAPAEAGEVAGGTQAKFGISIRTLNEEERDFTPEKKGVAVTRVEDGSFAEDIGLIERDIIVSVNRQPVNSVDDVKNVQANLKGGDAVAFRVIRRGPAMPQRGGVRAPQPITLYLSGTLPNE